MYKVLDVAQYIVDYSNEKGYFINSYKLQNILYFVQASFLCEKDAPCFSEGMEAVDWGVCIKQVLYRYRRYGLSSVFVMEDMRRASCIGKEDRKIIEEVVDECHGYSNNALIEIIRNQRPWKNGRMSMVDRISIEDLKRYFSEVC